MLTSMCWGRGMLGGWCARIAAIAALGAGAGAAVGQAPNDACSGAALAEGGPLVLDEDRGAVVEITPSITGGSACATGRDDAWFVFTAPHSGTFRFTVTGGGFPMAASLHTACPNANGTGAGAAVACDADCDAMGRVQRAMSEGQSVYLRAAACFEAGAGEAVVFFVRVDEAPAAPGNDACGGAEVLAPGGALQGTTRGATGAIPAQNCFGDFSSQDMLDVWYRFTNTAGAARVFSFAAVPSFDFFPVLRVYSSCGGASVSCAEPTGTDFSATLNRLMAPGETVLLRVAGVNLTEGEFTIIASEGAVPAANDSCAGAEALVPGQVVFATTAVATGATPETGVCSLDDTIDLWYSLANPAGAERMFVVEVNGAAGLAWPSLAAMTSCGGTVITCDSAASDLRPTRVSFLLGAGESVRLRVAGSLRSIGAFALSVSQPLDPPTPPANDACAGAAALTMFPAFVEVAAGAAGDDAATECDSQDGGAAKGVWYSIAPAEDGVLVYDWVEGAPELSLTLFDSCGAAAPVECEALSPALLSLEGGRSYRLLVSLQNAETATLDMVYRFTLDVREPLSPGETCAAAAALSLAPFTSVRGHFNNELAQNEGPGDAPTGSCNAEATSGMNASVYWRFVAPSNGNLVMEFDPIFVIGAAAVYRGECGALVERACTTSFGEPLSLNVPVSAGRSYLVQYGAAGSDWPGGDVLARFEFVPGGAGEPCPGDFNGAGGATVQDIYDFLTDWSSQVSGGPVVIASADFNTSGAVTVQDIYDFLTAWAAECG